MKLPRAGNDCTVHGLSFEPHRGEKAPYYGVRVGYCFGEAASSVRARPRVSRSSAGPRTFGASPARTAASRAGSEVGGVGVEGFAGLRFLLGKPLGVFVEPKYTHMWLTVGVATGGHADVTEPSAHVVGGLTVVSPWAWTSG